MELTTILEILTAVITALGGWEALRYVINLKTNKRKAEAEADSVDFKVLSDAVEFLETQLKQKEERFAEQTNLVRNLNAEVLELTKENGRLELELNRYKCVVKNCGNREPQNGY